jgi:hypothetical protein
MILAAMNGYLSVVTYLCENGADVNVQNDVSNYININYNIPYNND